jgi:hypothetical protein
MNRRRLVSLVALAAFILAAPLTALGGSPASVCPAGLTGSFPLCSIMPTFAGVNAESRLLPSGELGAETFLRAEDFTTYTEVDAGADITVAASSLTLDNLERDETAYVYKDFGSGYWSGDFDIRCKVNLSAVEVASTIYVFGISDDNSGDLQDVADNSGSAIAVRFYGISSSTYRADIFALNSGSVGSTNGSNEELAEGTDYYIRFYGNVLSGDDLNLVIATDYNFSNVVDSVTRTTNFNLAGQYLYAVSGRDSGSNGLATTGTISYLQLDTATYFNGVNVVKANGGEARFEPTVTGRTGEHESAGVFAGAGR